jgi:predicted metal-dependent hydrolase
VRIELDSGATPRARTRLVADLQSSPTAFRIERSTRSRRARLIVTDDAEAVVVLPARMPERVAFEMVVRHSAWIDRQVRLMSERSRELAARPPLGEGRFVPLEGVPHRVSFSRQPAGRSRSRARLNGETVVIEMADQDARTPAQVLDAWLRSRARLRIGDQVARRAAEMGLAMPYLSIRDQRTRWGSASRRGALSFSWRLVLCPPEVLDYVVVHELAHLRVAGHSARFWTLVNRHVEDSARPRKWLRENQDSLRRALD